MNWLLRSWRRWSLWMLLIALVAVLLGTLVWLAGRYEAEQVQGKIERDAAEAVSDIRLAFTRNVQNFEAVHAADGNANAWAQRALVLLHQHRELLRLEWRGAGPGGYHSRLC